ncbi:MAG TPA: porin family protein [Myxococcota bacterium]|nr:porin family protein [Myxococcota bacterium]
MKTRVAAALLVCLVSLVTRTARADGEFARSGAYIGVGASRSLNLVEDFLADDPVLKHIDASDNWGVNARAGYRLTSWFALEAEYEWLDDFNVRFGGIDLGTIGAQSATANLKLIGPFGRFQPYFLLGAGAIWVSVHDRFGAIDVTSPAFAGRVGIGMDVFLTQSFYLNVGAEGLLSPAKVSLNTGSLDASAHGVGAVNIQAGLGWRF